MNYSQQTPLSLCHAKWLAFSQMFNGYSCCLTVANKQHVAQTDWRFSINVKWFNHKSASFHQSSALRFEDSNGQPHIFTFTMPYDFFHDRDVGMSRPWKTQLRWLMSMLPRYWSALVLDKICEASNAGKKLFILKRPTGILKSKLATEKITILNPGEGYAILADADLKAPDYAVFDASADINSLLPF